MQAVRAGAVHELRFARARDVTAIVVVAHPGTVGVDDAVFRVDIADDPVAEGARHRRPVDLRLSRQDAVAACERAIGDIDPARIHGIPDSIGRDRGARQNPDAVAADAVLIACERARADRHRCRVNSAKVPSDGRIGDRYSPSNNRDRPCVDVRRCRRSQRASVPDDAAVVCAFDADAIRASRGEKLVTGEIERAAIRNEHRGAVG